MKKTLILLFVFLLLGGLAYLMVNKEETKISTVNAEDRHFAYPDVDNIGKIFIADRNGNINTLTRNGKGSEIWTVNGKYKVRPVVIQSILSTIKRIEMAFIPPRASIPNIVEVLGSHGVKVEVYDHDNNKLRAFYVGGTTNDEESTYMIMEGAEQPYAMKLPMLTGSVRNRFTQTEEEIRDREVFDVNPDDITYVSVEYPKQRNKSFILKKEEGKFSVEPFYNSTPAKKGALKKGVPEAFIYGFENMIAENFINQYKGRDSISRMVPFAIITIKEKNGESQEARFHPIRAKGKDGLPLKDSDVIEKSAVERYHLDHSRGDYYLIQQRIVGRAFWDYAQFFEEEKKMKN